MKAIVEDLSYLSIVDSIHRCMGIAMYTTIHAFSKDSRILSTNICVAYIPNILGSSYTNVVFLLRD